MTTLTTVTPLTTARALYAIGVPEWTTDGYGPHTAAIDGGTLWVDLAIEGGYAAAILWSDEYGDGTDLVEQEVGLYACVNDAKRAAVAAAVTVAVGDIQADDEIRRLIESEES